MEVLKQKTKGHRPGELLSGKVAAVCDTQHPKYTHRQTCRVTTKVEKISQRAEEKTTRYHMGERRRRETPSLRAGLKDSENEN